MKFKYLYLLVLFTLINLVFNNQFQLHYDETYYWAYGQNLALSYYDHPPMIAYAIRLFTGILGDTAIAVRLTATLSTLITIIFIYKLAKKMFEEYVANIALVLALACPLIEGIWFIVTPDCLLLMFWSMSLYYFYIALFEKKQYAFYVAGALSGLALLSKYTAVLLFPSLLCFLLMSSEHRKYLFKKEVYFSIIIAFVLFAPVIVWNMQHDWISFKFQYHHGINNQRIINFASFFDYLGGQILVSGILIFFSLMFFIAKYFKININNNKLAFLLCPYLFILCFFNYRSLFQHMEANWPAPAYISGIILLAYWLHFTRTKWITISAFLIITIVMILAKYPLPFIPKSMYNNAQIRIINTFFGYKELVSQIKPLINDNDILLACDYASASRVWFYLNSHKVYVLNNFKFAHAYTAWNNGILQTPHLIQHAYYICDSDNLEAIDALKENFKSYQLLNIFTYRNVVGENKLYFYEITNLKE